jgi:hypothetical protein
MECKLIKTFFSCFPKNSKVQKQVFTKRKTELSSFIGTNSFVKGGGGSRWHLCRCSSKPPLVDTETFGAVIIVPIRFFTLCARSTYLSRLGFPPSWLKQTSFQIFFFFLIFLRGGYNEARRRGITLYYHPRETTFKKSGWPSTLEEKKKKEK